ncbi:inositol monophosphatase family protein [Fodinibius sediminis]|uniref:Inositol-1-monophosphatase n=1 Tax=Fodinibius sediminis TaxID=1214077 RepID=A0A521D9P6_9BACT|nr:inositol monophosphatase family protein [Fodinibius sediminis]SMO68427.1 myo-inositol-1(or 4)-monophosphatase [Fodinibius sediminis]
MPDYTSELNIARQAAEKAAGIIREYQSANSFTINFKGKNDLVTDADVKTEEEIIALLEQEFPGDHILAEESFDQVRLPEDRTWLIDPIDGTTNFAHGFPVYCVSIALWEHREPQMGLVLEVSRDECFSAIAGKGAYLDGASISVSKIREPENALIGTGFPYNDLSLIDNYLDFFRMLMYKTQGVRRAGAAAYDLCCVASGRLDGFYEYALNPWDVGAAALLVREAGGQVSDWVGGDNWLLGQRIVAGNASVHQFLLEAIQQEFTPDELASIIP